MIPGSRLQHTLVPADLPRLFALAVRLGLRESIDYAALEPGLFAQSTVPSLDGIAENWVRNA